MPLSAEQTVIIVVVSDAYLPRHFSPRSSLSFTPRDGLSTVCLFDCIGATPVHAGCTRRHYATFSSFSTIAEDTPRL